MTRRSIFQYFYVYYWNCGTAMLGKKSENSKGGKNIENVNFLENSLTINDF